MKKIVIATCQKLSGRQVIVASAVAIQSMEKARNLILGDVPSAIMMKAQQQGQCLINANPDFDIFPTPKIIKRKI